MHQVLLAIEKGVKTIILFLSEYLTGKGLDYIISPPPPINVLEQRVTEAQGRTPLPQAMKEWDPKSLAPSEVLTALFEARYYASQLESSDEEIQAIAKEKILDLDISSISQELIDQGVLAVQKEIDRLLLDDPVIFQLKAQKDIYESYVADLNILKEALIHNRSAMLALAEQTAGREVDMLQRITGYTWDGSVDGYNYLVTQGKNEIDKIDPTVSDEMKEYREQMENAYIAVQGLFANEHYSISRDS